MLKVLIEFCLYITPTGVSWKTMIPVKKKFCAFLPFRLNLEWLTILRTNFKEKMIKIFRRWSVNEKERKGKIKKNEKKSKKERAKIWWHYVFCPTVDCPTNFCPTGPSPTVCVLLCVHWLFPSPFPLSSTKVAHSHYLVLLSIPSVFVLHPPLTSQPS